MKKVLWFTPSVFTSSGGQALHTMGYLKPLSKICNLKIVARNIGGANSTFDVDSLDVTLVSTFNKKRILNKFSQPINRYISKKTGVIALYHNILRVLRETADAFNPEIFVFDYIGTYNFYAWAKKRYPKAKFVYVSHNVEYLNFSSIRLENKKGSIFQKYWVKCRKNYERVMLCECDVSLCISISDIEKLKKEFPNCKNLLFSKPLIRFDRIKEKNDLKYFTKKLLIVGSMDWYPNINGIIWFIENVFKELIKQDSEYKLYLVGRRPDKKLMELEKIYKGNVIVTGQVESVDPYYKECDISIIPVFEGTGAKIKVLEALGKGIPSVCASFSAKDYNMKNGEMEIVQQDAVMFRDAIQKIASSVEKREKMYDQMQTYITEYYRINQDIISFFKDE